MEEKHGEPDYIRIYSDMIHRKYPEKYEICKDLLSKKKLDALEVLTLNNRIFGTGKRYPSVNGNYRSYDQKAILKMLDHQQKFKLSNIQLAKHFGLSRNTVAKWKTKYSLLNLTVQHEEML